MPVQPDLFAADTPPAAPPGLTLAEPAIDADWERRLAQHIDDSGLEPFRFQQWTGKRLTRSFGWHYDFTGGGLRRGDAMPDWLLRLRGTVAASFGEEPGAFEQALVIRYDPGAGIGWHRDRPQFGRVIGLSLGAAAEMRLRLRRRDGGFERFSVPLDPRAAYRLDGEARRDWEHSILPMEETRWSVTFRSLADDAGRDGAFQRG
ncbi:alpha-ketoglutarate-dependent dioxygenase AlkB [uncultured Croceicoccus sp.]|uniref:alpha-ketoglutarate-dependent dioxygenase AlkB n=1 Tax=uncultured Croceicoccus sp. TaxID=1295329 RepID=UPI002619C569|nr:alpha-ketoglutarate-dependent dioxygenase AlkB [uncultured Croceicoccus sp.]